MSAKPCRLDAPRPTITRQALHRRTDELVRTLRALLVDARPGSEKAADYERAAVEAIELLEEAVGRG